MWKIMFSCMFGLILSLLCANWKEMCVFMSSSSPSLEHARWRLYFPPHSTANDSFVNFQPPLQGLQQQQQHDKAENKFSPVTTLFISTSRRMSEGFVKSSFFNWNLSLLLSETAATHPMQNSSFQIAIFSRLILDYSRRREIGNKSCHVFIITR